MQWPSFISKYFGQKEIFAVDFDRHDTDDFTIILTKVDFSDQDELKVDRPISFQNFRSFIQWLDDQKDLDIALNINGKGILNKKVTESWDNREELLKHVIPNNKGSDDAFFVQHMTTPMSTVVSLTRKSNIIDILHLFGRFQKRIIRLSIGLPVLGYIDLLSPEKNIVRPDYTLLLNTQKQVEAIVIKTSDESETVNENEPLIAKEPIFGRNIKGLLTALSLQHQLSNITLEQPTILKQNRKESKQRKIFNIAAPALLLISFLALLINFFIFSQATSTQQEIGSVFTIQTSAIKTYEKAQASLVQKREIIKKLGITGNDNLSTYIDRLGQSVPGEISLERVHISPIEVEKRKNSFSLRGNHILIQGETASPLAFSNWLVNLEGKTWIRSITDEKYEFRPKQGKGIFSFLVEINEK